MNKTLFNELTNIAFDMTDSQLAEVIKYARFIVADKAVAPVEVSTPAPTPTPSAPKSKPSAKLPKSEDKPVQQKSAPKKSDAPKADVASAKVLRVDKHGLQWIAEYNDAEYQARKQEMIANGTYDCKHRDAVYRSLGWVL